MIGGALLRSYFGTVSFRRKTDFPNNLEYRTALNSRTLYNFCILKSKRRLARRSSSPRSLIQGTLVFRHDSFGDVLYPHLYQNLKELADIAPFAPYRSEVIFEKHPEAVLPVFAEHFITQAILDDFY